MNLNDWLRDMSAFEPMVLQFLDARRESLMELMVSVAREAEEAVVAVKTSYDDLIEMVQEVDRNASEWVETNFEDAPAVLMVAIMIVMFVTVMAVVWGKETLEQQAEEDLKVIEEERTMDDDMLELIKSKLTLTKQLDDIAVIQDEARKEIIKDALALAILSDRLSVINNIKKDIPSSEKENVMPKENTEIQVQSQEDNSVTLSS
ncbi:uncharacterized protein LOC126278376 [Schistocerca gregaria]|uniref:uncharacterized protein LOC126278376 n=1 Tax=Schistocerca gregaria TaxID=7010 RepID=UPI00211DE15B|nr:uncharacterized protein LOC126278376 [Schistocerca gregaria]XP_049834409.1 uncharacterized protein LOC126278376 [Schistocerca gregaria]XP_049834410.1 uncharacterized protein LOC126278376 [Schistocerca gregaria]